MHGGIVKQDIASLVNLCTQLIEALDNHRCIYTYCIPLRCVT